MSQMTASAKRSTPERQVRRSRGVHGIGAAIQELRQSLSLGQVEFAKKLDANQAAICRWEKETRPVPIEVVLKLAHLAMPKDKAFWFGKAGAL